MLKIEKSHKISLLTFLMLIFTLPFSLAAYQGSQFLDEFESRLGAAANSPNHFVLAVKDWDSLKTYLNTDKSLLLKKQDSLFNVVAMQAALLSEEKRVNSLPIQTARAHNDPLLLALNVLFGIMIIGGLIYIFKINSSFSDVKDICIDLECRYEQSKKHWIDKERQLKRELIDTRNKLEDFQKEFRA
ncbi:hypothetical protein CLW00_104216 [Mongoliibacter ruber]|uniref:Uncharacterized protein n=2 Tax=Mongoliibacter ruber TaxID=1750599 RepID=A0A2T0WPF1_9BACT|nr:hypothetical protein CLW00_104216 [Mongoliibacter ruber]